MGTISYKQAPVLKRIYDQMPTPKWVVAYGACASSGGFYNNYNTLQGIDEIIPVDVYVPGCPPRPEQLFEAILKIQKELLSRDAGSGTPATQTSAGRRDASPEMEE
jgi:NADH-quinone oxidoreductase subunit B